MALETRHTALAAAGATAGWLALLLLAMQLGYSYDLYWLLKRDFEMLVAALAGLGVTLLMIFWRSAASHQDKVMIGLVALIALFGLSIAGGLFVACNNDNCL